MKLHLINLSQMKIPFTIFFLIVLTFISSLSANVQPLNLNAVIDNATKEGKQVAVYFHMSNCVYCTRMGNRTFKDPDVIKRLEKSFVVVDAKIDDTQTIVFDKTSYSKKDFANSIDVDFYPTVLFFDKDYYVTYMVRGYRDNKKFQEILKFIETKSYESMDFFDYERQIKEKEE
ncbi:MAG: thioredoxin fold domain-containing protein [Arcobacteraceae bacterium]